ncbi:hypothetical protein CWRG_02788 [Chthonomonas calidirosea]|uniref:hypothetical protein n=1 Tax=Chthonomonas calidirosea TaxID=454171 RepID=UPI0006DD55E1|nr:hypothetical protein [Chthonomonas calidirosea]CEK20299.1 hypothetical protein CWRG_02788 [Chthonomonas calidirosea]CEK20300.1 hypothetical protein CP488_02811 [Chthonomonas calidirosea]
MARAVGFLLLTALAGLVAYWLLAPRLLRTTAISQPNGSLPTTHVPAARSTPASSSANMSNGATIPPSSIPPPLSQEQLNDIARENQRTPYYDWLRNSSNGLVQQAYADTDRTVLIVQLAGAEPDALTVLFNRAIVPYANRYGFLHVRFYVPISPDNPQDRRLYAEASLTNNSWQLFFR